MTRKQILKLASFSGFLFLAACGGAAPVARVVCPVIAEYSTEDQAKASKEYAALKSSGKYPIIVKMIDDYGVTRNEIRACNDDPKNPDKI